MHDFGARIPNVIPVPLPAETSPYVYPAISGADLEILPHDGCLGCPLAQSALNHSTYDRRRLNADSGGPYYGPPSWDSVHTLPGAHWIRQAQAALYWLSKIAHRFTTYGWTASGYDYYENNVPNPIVISSHAVLSANGNRIEIDCSESYADPRNGMGGTPYMVGDGVVFSGNNLATRMNARMLIGIDDPPGHGDEKPSSVTLVLDADVGDLCMISADDEEEWTCYAAICREVDMPLPWVGYYDWNAETPITGFYADRESFFYGSRIVREFITDPGEWEETEDFALTDANDGDCEVALPMSGETGVNRTLVVETWDGSTWTDATSAITGLYTFDGAGALRVSGGASVLRLSAADFSESFSKLRITYYARTAADDYAGKATNVCAGQCRWSWPDWGGIWGVGGGAHDAEGVTWFCINHGSASGAGNFTPRCYQVNTCDMFEPIPADAFWTMAALRAAVDQIWNCGPPLVLWRLTPIPPNNQIVLYRRGVPSILGMFTPAAEQEYGNNSVELHQPLECGAFGRIDEANAWHAGAASEYPADSELPAAPSAGALAFLIGEALEGEYPPWQNLVNRDGLIGNHDPCGEWRYWPLYNLAATDRNWGDNLWGDSLSRFQARAGGYAASEQVLLSGINTTSLSEQSLRDGRIQFGAWDEDFEPCAAENAEYGAKVWLYPMPWPSVAGPLISAAAPPGYNSEDFAPYIYGQIHSIALDSGAGNNVYKIIVKPSDTGLGFYAGGNFCGVPNWARLRIETAPLWYSHLGPHHGARVGHAVSFHVNNSGEPTADAAITIPWIDDDSNPIPAAFVIRKAAPFGIVDTDGNQSSTGFHWTTGEIGSQGGGLPAYEGYPPDFVDWGNVCDAVWVADDNGILAAALDAETIGAGDWILLRADHTFGWAGSGCAGDGDAVYARWTAREADDWVDISSSLTQYHAVNGCYFIGADAAEDMKSEPSICLRFDCQEGRLGRTAYYWANTINMTRLAIEAMTTAQSEWVGGGYSLLAWHWQWLNYDDSYGQGISAPPLALSDGNTYGLVDAEENDGPGGYGYGATEAAAKAAASANVSGSGWWGWFRSPSTSSPYTPTGTDWVMQAEKEFIQPIAGTEAFGNGINVGETHLGAHIRRHWWIRQTGFSFVPQLAVNLPDGGTVEQCVAPARVKIGTYIWQRKTVYVSCAVVTWERGTGDWVGIPYWTSIGDLYDLYSAGVDPNPPYDGMGDDYSEEPASGVTLALVGVPPGDVVYGGVPYVILATAGIEVNESGDDSYHDTDFTSIAQAYMDSRLDSQFEHIQGIVISALNSGEPGYPKESWTSLGEYPASSGIYHWRVDFEQERLTSPEVSLGTPVVKFAGDADVLVPAQGPPMNMPDMED